MNGDFVIKDQSRLVRLVVSLLMMVLPGLLMAWTVLRLGHGETTAYATAAAGGLLAMLGAVFAGLGSSVVIDRARHCLVENTTLLGVPVRRKVMGLDTPKLVVLRIRRVVLNPHDRERRATTTYSDLVLVTSTGELPINNGSNRNDSLEVGQRLSRYLGVDFAEERVPQGARGDLIRQPLRLKILVGIVVFLLVGGAVFRLVEVIAVG